MLKVVITVHLNFKCLLKANFIVTKLAKKVTMYIPNTDEHFPHKKPQSQIIPFSITDIICLLTLTSLTTSEYILH